MPHEDSNDALSRVREPVPFASSNVQIVVLQLTYSVKRLDGSEKFEMVVLEASFADPPFVEAVKAAAMKQLALPGSTAMYALHRLDDGGLSAAAELDPSTVVSETSLPTFSKLILRPITGMLPNAGTIGYAVSLIPQHVPVFRPASVRFDDCNHSSNVKSFVRLGATASSCSSSRGCTTSRLGEQRHRRPEILCIVLRIDYERKQNYHFWQPWHRFVCAHSPRSKLK